MKGVLELNKDLHRKGKVLSTILEDAKKISLEFLELDSFKYQFKLHKIDVPEFLLELIYKKYNIHNDGMIACQIFIEDFINFT